MSSVRFVPVRGTAAEINRVPLTDGQVYYAYDTGRIYLDVDEFDTGEVSRVPIGGAGIAIFYGTLKGDLETDEEQGYTIYPLSGLEQQGVTPNIGDFIFNVDGAIYRIVDIRESNCYCSPYYTGGGGGSGGGGSQPDLILIAAESSAQNVANGQTVEIALRGISDTASDGTILEDPLTINWWLTESNSATGTRFADGTVSCPSGSTVKVNITNYLRQSSTQYFWAQIYGGEGYAHQYSSTRVSRVVNTYAMSVSPSGVNRTEFPSYSPTNTILEYAVNTGELEKNVTCYFYSYDSEGAESGVYTLRQQNLAPSINEVNFTIPSSIATHGLHKVIIELESTSGMKAPSYSQYIIVADPNNNTPIIFLDDDIREEYYPYETILIPYSVYCSSPNAQIRLSFYEDGILDYENTVSPFFGTWQNREIVPKQVDTEFTYSIVAQYNEFETAVQIPVRIVQDPQRPNMAINTTSLKLMFDPVGRSNIETSANRSKWSYTDESASKVYTGVFENFNWLDNGNGWHFDDIERSTCLRITNGAKFSITGFDAINFSPSSNWTFELQFKVSRIKNYRDLVSSTTVYYYYDDEGIKHSDEEIYQAFLEQNVYDNYELFLRDELMSGLTSDQVDNLEYRTIITRYNVEQIVYGQYTTSGSNNSSIIGLGISPSDVFFSNGVETVTTNIIPDEIINLSFVYMGSLQMLMIYVNGVIAGAKYIENTNFTIQANDIVFKSDNCDIDLYKFRIYNIGLSLQQIITNYSVDRRLVDVYDQLSGIAVLLPEIQEYQLSLKKIQQYNREHPEAPTIPYMLLEAKDLNESTTQNRLPYSKEVDIGVKAEFINAPLDALMEREADLLVELRKEDWVSSSLTAADSDFAEIKKKYYLHNCPSFTTDITGQSYCELSVQGTSSQFYPRRNFKLKVDTDGYDSGALEDEKYMHIFLHKGPYAETFATDQEDVLANLSDYDPNGENPKSLEDLDSCSKDGWYFNNYTNTTDRWTLKVDYMESSGSYNAGFANMVGNCYTKHPLQDYIAAGAINEGDALQTLKNDGLVSNLEINGVQMFNAIRWHDFRTSMQGFPIMMFQKLSDSEKNAAGENWDDYKFIGYYRMLIDKGSDMILGFDIEPKNSYYRGRSLDDEKIKLDEEGEPHLVYDDNKAKKMKNVCECWEYSDNQGTFCSFRDPLNRVELQFAVNEEFPNGDLNPNAFQHTENGAPLVMGSFEHRYHWAEDFLDLVIDYNGTQTGDIEKALSAAEIKSSNSKVEVIDPDGIAVDPKPEDIILTYYELASDAYEMGWDWDTDALLQKNQSTFDKISLELYSNWERACAWVWSTNIENVISEGTYNVRADLCEALYESGIYYILETTDDETTDYVLDSGEYDPEQSYYIYDIESESYMPIRLTNSLSSVYTINTYYTYNEEDSTYTLHTEEFNPDLTYYEFVSLTEEQLEARADRLMTKATSYSAGEQYYTKNKLAKVVVPNEDDPEPTSKTDYWKAASLSLSEEEFKAGEYYIPTSYNGGQYKYDTKEYRRWKFQHELSDHFDKEYISTYFIMTEVFECFDSRGKNCMMASWGPLEEGGDFIWYPIFYDIDTQLGINNTGIPSFTYNIDFTESNNYSTPDNLLWNNFYREFQSDILNKYKQLRINNSTYEGAQLQTTYRSSLAPLNSAEWIEGQYLFNYDVTGNYACTGTKLMLATNLDMYFKYITPANPLMFQNVDNVYIHHLLPLSSSGEYYSSVFRERLFALQGDRQFSRLDFITSRLDYIDSWLGVNNYSRDSSGSLVNCRINGNFTPETGFRNNGLEISDVWIENSSDMANTSYWMNTSSSGLPNYLEYGTKRHTFDGEYWVQLTPYQSTYVTIGLDNNALPSQKYDGLNPVRMTASTLKEKYLHSAPVYQQLFYIYGIHNLIDLGTFYNLYPQEFFITGTFEKLQTLLLGWDGLDTEGNKWYSTNLMVPPSLNNLPMLTNLNLSNIKFKLDEGVTTTTINVSGSSSLQILRATGTNISDISFADGVSLHTLYLPASLVNLKLTQANNLTTFIDQATMPTVQTDGSIERGLFIEGFVSSGDKMDTSSLNSINIAGNALNYGSYKILQRLYNTYYNTSNNCYITLTDLNWCPYVQCKEGDVYDESLTYYTDDKHFGLVEYEASENDFIENSPLILNGTLYYKNNVLEGDSSLITNNIMSILQNLYHGENFFDASANDNTTKPNLTGLIYIDDDTQIEETDIFALQDSDIYPNLSIFAKNVNKAYSAEFLYQPDPKVEQYEYVDVIGDTAAKSIQRIAVDAGATFFESPGFPDAPGLYNPKKTHYDFVGWSTNPKASPDSNEVIKTQEEWEEQIFVPDQYTYTYYAIFKITSYTITFKSGNDTDPDVQVKYDYGTIGIETPELVPYQEEPEDMNPLETYGFIGYTDNQLTSMIVDLSTYVVRNNTTFYPVFESISVFDNIHPEYFSGTYVSAIHGVQLNLIKQVTGKITIPNTIKVDGVERDVIMLTDSFNAIHMGASLTHVFFEPGTKVTTFMTNSFSGEDGHNQSLSSLKFIEFPPSLTTIESSAFLRCNKLDPIEVIDSIRNHGVSTSDYPASRYSGENITQIMDSAFDQAFAQKSIDTFIIRPNVERLGALAFRNIGYAYATLQIGDASKAAQVDFSNTGTGASGTNYVFQLGGQIRYAPDSVYFYTNRYTDASQLTAYFSARFISDAEWSFIEV